MKAKVFFLTLLLFCLTNVRLYSTNVFTDTTPYMYFRNIQLPADANIVNTMVEDNSGIMWVGTKRGLFRFDGYKFHAFYNGTESNGNTVQSLLVMDDKTLAVGTDDGLRLFDIRKEKFLPCEKGLREIESVRSFAQDHDYLYIGTKEKGLFKYNKTSHKLSKILDSHGYIIYSIATIGNNIYAVTHQGVVVYNIKDRKIVSLQHLPSQYNLFCLYHHPKSDLLIIGASGMIIAYSLNRHDYKLLNVPTSYIYRSIAQDKNGTLICATDMGIISIDKQGHVLHYVHSTRNPQTISNNYVWRIFIDSHNNVWATSNRGLSVSSPNLSSKTIPMTAITDSDDGNLFNHIAVDSKNNYWLGGDNGIILYQHQNGNWMSRWYRPDNKQWILPDNNIHNIYQDADGEIWIMTDGSFVRYDKANGKLENYFLLRPNGKSTEWSYSMVEDAQHRLWISTYMSGLFVIDKKKLIESNGKIEYKDAYFPHNSTVNTIYQMFLDKHGIIWANTGEGLARISTKDLSVKTYNAYMDYMTFDGNKVWYVSLGKIYCFDTKTEKIKQLAFSADDGIIYTLVPQGNRVWFTTAKGIYYINVENCSINLYQLTNDSYYTGCYDQTNKQLIFAGEDKFLICKAELTKSNNQSRVYVTAITKDGILLEPGDGYEGESSRYLNKIRIKTRGNITLELSTLDFSPLAKISYYYRLGDKDTWHEVEENAINFASMPSGSYNLYLCTDPAQAAEGKGITTYRLVVPYPWYLSLPMILLYVLLLIAAVIGIIYYYQRRNKRKYELKEKEKTMELAQHKMDFFVNMSHELKTPLSLIIAPLSKLMSEVKDTSVLEALKGINRNAVKLSTLIYRILDFKKMEYTVEDSLLRSHTEIVTLLQGCIGSFSEEAQKKGIGIKFKSDIDSLWMNIDALKIESVINNLLSNALKYSPENTGIISVSLSVDNEWMRVSIADNGKGVSNSELPNLFTKYFQGQNASNHEGSGIGLYLVKKFTEMHGGKVSATNDNGLKITIAIPLTGENIIGTVKNIASDKKEDKSQSLLIVDDNEEMLDFLTRSFEKNYHCVTATNGKEALKIMENFTPDLIIADDMMPVMDGLTLVKNIRSTQRIASLPVIMLTAKDDEETEMGSIKAGADLFMAKPFDLRKLSLHVVQLIQSRKAMDKQRNLQTIANPVFKQDKAKDSDEAFLENITKCIEENMQDENFNVSKLSELVGMDQKKIYRKLKQLIGKTPIAFLKQLRMKKAATLLKDGSFTVSEVMYLVGYSNASYFSKCFAEEYGVTPKEYGANKKE